MKIKELLEKLKEESLDHELFVRSPYGVGSEEIWIVGYDDDEENIIYEKQIL